MSGPVIPGQLSIWEQLSESAEVITPEQALNGVPVGSYNHGLHRQPYQSKFHAMPFCGVDGEGGNLETAQQPLWEHSTTHEYLLLRAGEFVLDTGKPLGWEECFSFLADLPHNRVFVSYFFDYDVTMMIRSLTPERLRRLLRRSLRTVAENGKNAQTLPVDVGDFQIDYLPKKEFRVRRHGGQWTVVHDTGTFFQTAFVKVLNRWDIGTPEERESIARGKEQRANFGSLTEETRVYNALECRLLEELMGKFRDVCRQLGYLPTRWQGPGNLAVAMFRKHSVPPNRALGPVMENGALLNFARSAYYGGRFEIGAVGPIRSAVDQWDINSAYPDALVSLPCLVHGTWEYTEQPFGLRDHDWYCADIDFRAKMSAHFYAFPWRSPKGSIAFPGSGRGWYWSPEIREGSRLHSIKVHGAWIYHRECECVPFSWIPGVYNARQRLGKDGKGLVLKLGLNSLYGKIAQSVGKPAYANPIWSGMITSLTRAKLLQGMRVWGDGGRRVYMLATDGIFCEHGALDHLTPSKELGGWDLTTHENGIFIIQPGLYFAEEGSPKTRGVPQSAIKTRRDLFEAEFQKVREARDGRAGKVPIPLTNFIGARYALHADRLAQAGQWVTEDHTVSFDWTTKRVAPESLSNPFLIDPYLKVLPKRTTPYTRTLGAEMSLLVEAEHDRMLAEEQPDWIPEVLSQ